jgi:hypothetical protein
MGMRTATEMEMEMVTGMATEMETATGMETATEMETARNRSRG